MDTLGGRSFSSFSQMPRPIEPQSGLRGVITHARIRPWRPFGWEGSSQRPTDRTPNLTSLIQMGARPYAPQIGRFLAVDPVEGGATTNPYGYVNDPINTEDLTGLGMNCAKKTSSGKVKRSIKTSYSGGRIRVKCGNGDWGLRHIQARNHMNEYAKYFPPGEDMFNKYFWNILDATVRSPERIDIGNNNTAVFKATAVFQKIPVGPGSSVKYECLMITMNVVVVDDSLQKARNGSAGYGDVITAYGSDARSCGGTPR